MLNLTDNPTIYVTRDIERALGIPVNTKGYFIISNYSDFAKSYKKNRNILLIKAKPRTDRGSGTGEKEQLDTWELLQNKKVKKFIGTLSSRAHPANAGEAEGSLKQSKRDSSTGACPERTSRGGRNDTHAKILVFKNTLQIEKTCAENGWELLNPPAKISNAVEEKISQITWLGPLKKYLPKYQVLKCKDIDLEKESQRNYFSEVRTKQSEPATRENNSSKFFKPFILQFNRSHTGNGTFLITNEQQLVELQQKFPEREVRIAEYIPGPLFTNNNVVTKNAILLGNLNYQITGLKPFTDLSLSTIGNDWALPHKILNKKQIAEYNKIANEVGLRLQKAGWCGLFGIDVVQNEHTKKLYLLEINCRQPASTTYESQLQLSVIPSEVKRSRGIPYTTTKGFLHSSRDSVGMTDEVTTFEAHLLSLTNFDLKNKKLIKINNGAQIIQRVTQHTPVINIPKITKKQFFNYFVYNNSKDNADLLRLQTTVGIMKEHNILNDYGRILQYFVIGAKDGKPWCADRAAGIIIKDNKILVIKRNKYGEEFYIFPGGTVEKGEKLKETAIREIKEETNLTCTLQKTKPLFYEDKIDGKKIYHYFIDKCTGTAKIKSNSEEFIRNKEGNTYELVWIDLLELKNIELHPIEIKKELLKKYV
ncbi:MAG: hypothetical protein US42_C0001G0055 [Candidatus Magasanikbacteria bacterium GW2011_GWC2_37_14]|uniref:Nudix hydrolase domain-containing protein n=1 Tax=Candidatus Magasanikbacteria bacterium GW2011_GWC2_37_14 TaxID=1619046 RepID=A0A0G0IVN8_9BACT|nr:MAG: hypothetical protein US42_C0001G0055 [Candidatus Magasanikbacteria bacterium GW2011_GWC2_37_14]